MTTKVNNELLKTCRYYENFGDRKSEDKSKDCSMVFSPRRIDQVFCCNECKWAFHARTRTKTYKLQPVHKSLKERIDDLEACLEEIERVALVSEGVEFYAMLARKGLDGEYVRDPQP